MTEQPSTRDDALARYEAGPAALRAALSGLSQAELDLTQAPGEWTIRQIVHHLAEGDVLFGVLIKTSVGNPGCTFSLPPYTNNEEWAVAQQWTARAVEPALELFAATRADIAELLRRVPGAWEQHVRIPAPDAPEGREFGAAGLIPMLADHAQEHIDQILAVRRAHGV
jgi:hypothetical protein